MENIPIGGLRCIAAPPIFFWQLTRYYWWILSKKKKNRKKSWEKSIFFCPKIGTPLSISPPPPPPPPPRSKIELFSTIIIHLKEHFVGKNSGKNVKWVWKFRGKLVIFRNQKCFFFEAWTLQQFCSKPVFYYSWPVGPPILWSFPPIFCLGIKFPHPSKFPPCERDSNMHI